MVVLKDDRDSLKFNVHPRFFSAFRTMEMGVQCSLFRKQNRQCLIESGTSLSIAVYEFE
jgi:hypothetical protein